MTDREAMKMALGALEGIHVGNMTPMAEENWNKALIALRQALAQPEQEKTMNGMTEKECESMRRQSTLGYEQPEPEQEPLCWLKETGSIGGGYEQTAWGDTSGFPVFTAPPSKQDVNQELVEALNDLLDKNFDREAAEANARAAIAKAEGDEK